MANGQLTQTDLKVLGRMSPHWYDEHWDSIVSGAEMWRESDEYRRALDEFNAEEAQQLDKSHEAELKQLDELIANAERLKRRLDGGGQ